MYVGVIVLSLWKLYPVHTNLIYLFSSFLQFFSSIRNLLAACKILLTFNSYPFCRRHHSLGLNRHHSLGLGTIMPEVKKEFTDEEMKVTAYIIKSLRTAANYLKWSISNFFFIFRSVSNATSARLTSALLEILQGGYQE